MLNRLLNEREIFAYTINKPKIDKKTPQNSISYDFTFFVREIRMIYSANDITRKGHRTTIKSLISNLN